MWREGFELARRRLDDWGASEEELDDFEERLQKSKLVSAMLLPMLRDLERAARFAEVRFALARTALRLVQHGRKAWETVPREIDPWTNAPFAAEARGAERIVLRSAGRERPSGEEGTGADARDWIVFLR